MGDEGGAGFAPCHELVEKLNRRVIGDLILHGDHCGQPLLHQGGRGRGEDIGLAGVGSFAGVE